AEAILAIAPRLGEGFSAWGTYHFAGGGATSRFELARRIVAAQGLHTGRHPDVLPIASSDYPVPAKRPANSVLDSSRFARTCGISARPWEEAVDATVAECFAGK